MHSVQTALLTLIRDEKINGMGLRQMARLIGVENKPQIVKHHLLQLEKAGLIQPSFGKALFKATARGSNADSVKSPFYSLPIVGAANCGPANIFADERVEGYLKVSLRMLPRKKSDLYVLVADGPSMNRAEVRDGLTIEDGDFVVVDSTYSSPKNGDIIVAVIDGMATIKRYTKDRKGDLIVLEAVSTETFMPIFLHEGDNFVISGKVVDVIKRSK